MRGMQLMCNTGRHTTYALVAGDDDAADSGITGGKRMIILPVLAPDSCAINDGTN